MTPDDFLSEALAAAIRGSHIWPEYAACEAALESGWGESKLARQANNLFGQKCGSLSRAYPALALPTHEDEVINGAMQVVKVDAHWPIFPDWETSFRERMRELQLAQHPRAGGLLYADALAAQNGEDFVRRVSKVWATDPARADKVLAIYRKHFPAVLVLDPEVRA